METRFSRLEKLIDKRLTLRQLTELRDSETLEPIPTDSSKPTTPRKRPGTTTLLIEAQKYLSEAQDMQDAATKANKVDEYKAATKQVEYRTSILNQLYALASGKLDSVKGDIVNCPFKNNTDSDTGYSQFWHAVQCFQSAETYLLLLQRYLVFKKKQDELLLKEQLAPEIIELLSQDFCHPTEDKDESTFFGAVRIQNTAAMKVMLDLLPELAFRANKNLFPPAHFAAMSGNVRALDCLMQADARTITQPLHGSEMTTLMVAHAYRQYKSMQWLLENAPAMRDGKNQNGETVLHQAVISGDAESVALLLTHKVNITILTGKTSKHPEMTALDIAVKLAPKSPANTQVLDVLMQHYEEGYTLLHRSILEEQVVLLKLLCNCGADLTVKSSATATCPNMTSLQLAYSQRKNEALYAILEHCCEAAEREAERVAELNAHSEEWQKKSEKEKQLELLKVKFIKMEQMLALEKCPVLDIAPPMNYAEPEKDDIGQLADPLKWAFSYITYFKMRNTGKKHTSRPTGDGVKKAFSESLKYADRIVGDWTGVKVSDLTVIKEIRDVMSYDELDKLSVVWRAILYILQKFTDPAACFTEDELQIFKNGRLKDYAKPMLDHHEAELQRAEAAASNSDEDKGRRNVFY